LPHHKSCKKRLVTSLKRRESNRDNKAAMRSQVKTFRSPSTGVEARAEQLSEMYSTVDVMARKGIIPRKRASRMKSRLAALAVK